MQISAFTSTASLFNFCIQSLLNAFVCLLSKTIIPTSCPKRFLTFCIMSAPDTPFGTSVILSNGKVTRKISSIANSCA